MKRLILFLGAMLLSFSIHATTTNLWNGEAISVTWSTQHAIQTASQAATLLPGDRIVIAVSAINGADAQLGIRNSNGWGSIGAYQPVTATGNLTIVLSEEMVQTMKENGYFIGGANVSITRIDHVRLGSQEQGSIWSGSLQLGWKNANKYIPFTAPYSLMLQAGDQLEVTFTRTGEATAYMYIYEGYESLSGEGHLAVQNIAANATTATFNLTEELLTQMANGFSIGGGNVITVSDVTLKKTEILAPGAEKVLWEGDQTLASYGQVIVEKDASFAEAMLEDGDAIAVSVKSKGSNSWPKIYLKNGSNAQVGDLYELHNQETFPYVVVLTLSSDMVTNLQSGLKVAGTEGVEVTQVVLRKASTTAASTTTNLWTGDETISWDPSKYGTVNNSITTKNAPYSIDFSSLQSGDTIKIEISDVESGDGKYPQYILYHLNPGWVRIDGAGVAGMSAIKYVVPDSIVESIRSNGIILSGIYFHARSISVITPKRTTITENQDPTATLTAQLNQQVDFVIDRTFYRDGYFNTLCVPFNFTAEQIANSELSDATIKRFLTATVTEVSGDYSLDLEVETVTELTAGVPYLVKFPIGEDLDQLSFHGVTISATTPSSITGGGVTCWGMFAPRHLASGHDYLFMGANDELYWPSDSDTASDKLKGFRAYFKVNTIETAAQGAPIYRGMGARIVEHQNTATEIENAQDNVPSVQKIIKDGQVIIVRNGVQYTIVGLVYQK